MDKLTTLPNDLENPRDAKASDFSGPKSKHGWMEGFGQLVDQSGNQWAVRHVEDGGPGSSGAGTPADNPAKGVAKAFPVSKSTSEGGKAVSSNCSVDVVSGKHNCKL